MPGLLAPSTFTRTALQRGSSVSSLSHYTLASAFPIRLHTLASLRHSEHLLLKISEASGTKEVGQACIPIALFLPLNEPEAAKKPSTSSSTPPPRPATLPTAATATSSVSCDEVIEATAAPQGRHRAGALRFPLTSGGAFKGWVKLEMRVRAKPLEPPSG